MIIIPPTRNPWVDLSRDIGQGMFQTAQLQNQRQQQEMANAIEKLKLGVFLADQEEKQRQRQLAQQPSPLGFITKTTRPNIPGVTGMEQYVPEGFKTSTETTHMPMNWEQIKMLGPSVNELIKQGVIGTGGETKESIEPTEDFGYGQRRGKTTGKIYSVPVPPREPGLPPVMDWIGARVFGQKYQTPEGRAEFLQWMENPQNATKIKQLGDEYVKMTQPPGITYQVTDKGIVGLPTKYGSVGPVKDTGGEQLRKPLGEAQLAKVGELNAILSNIQETKDLYGYGTNKEHNEWVGPLAGRLGGIQAKYTGTAGEDQVKFYAYVKDMQDALLRARSGAQINEQEYQRLVAFLPDPNLPAPTFNARLDRFEKATQIVLNERLKAFEQSGYGTGQKGQQPSAPINGRERAIAELKKRGKVVNEDSIKQAMKLMGVK